MKKMAVVISSCDTYEDLWAPFFGCLDRFWGNIPYPVYLNTEHKVYNDGCNNFPITTINQKTKRNISWSRRFLDILDTIPEDYIFLLLDDFFLCDSVSNHYFEEILDLMEADYSIASFQLNGTRIRNANPEQYQLEEILKCKLMDSNGWKTHFVPTVWRKSILKKWLRPWESIWAFEGCGSARARRRHYPENVYIVESPPVYDYLWIKDCSAVVNGKWINEPELTSFFETNRIPVEYSQRGMMTLEEYQAINMATIIKRYTIWQVIVKSINRIRSYW